MTGLYVQLDTNWPDHPKIIAAGLEGAGLHAIALCLAKRLETDGVLHRTHLLRLGGTPELIERLIELELFDPVDRDRIAVHDWLDRNPSRGAIRGRRSWDGRRGNHKRWGHPGEVETCTICATTVVDVDPQVIGRVSPPDRPPDSPPDRPRESGLSLETETETETEGGRSRPTTNGPSATGPPPRLCAQHRDYPEGAHIPACGRCADARRGADAWAAAHPAPQPDRYDHRLDDQQTAGLAKAQQNLSALDRTPPDVERNLAGIAEARAATRTRPAPQEAPE